MAKPVKAEIDRIEALLKGDVTPKQKLCLIIAHQTLKWQDSLGRENTPTLEPPSKQIMRNGEKPT